MARIQFQVESVDFGQAHVLVIGRCCASGFCVGDVFNSLEGCRFGKYDDKTGVRPRTGETAVVAVNLRVEEISFCGELVENLGTGYVAGLRLTGGELDTLRRVEQPSDLVWSLWGETGGTS